MHEKTDSVCRDCRGGLLKEADSGGTPSLQDAADAPRVLPLSGDELAALAWLEHVTGPLGAEEERELWDIGGTQHGIFAKRYHLPRRVSRLAVQGDEKSGLGQCVIVPCLRCTVVNSRKAKLLKAEAESRR